jgi:hypothetical protein
MTLRIIPQPTFGVPEIEAVRWGLLLSERGGRAVARGPGQFESAGEILQRARAAGTLHGTPETGGEDSETPEQRP